MRNCNVPLLSICIPTYNRADILKKSLESIVSQEEFLDGNEVEVVISDNCSSDNTPEVAQDFVKKFGHKIKYFRNKENIENRNFALVLSQGNGEFLKICNDTLIYQPNSLKYLLHCVREYQKDKKVLFFFNSKKDKNINCQSLDDFVTNVSFMSTWIGGFGIWKSDIKYLSYMEKYANTYLSQVAVLMKMLEQKGGSVLCVQKFCELAHPSVSGNYNLSKVFIINYGNILNEYVQKNKLSKKVYKKEMWQVLKKHVLPRQFNVKYNFKYDKSTFWQDTKIYHKSIKFYYYLLKTFIKKFKYFFKGIR